MYVGFVAALAVAYGGYLSLRTESSPFGDPSSIVSYTDLAGLKRLREEGCLRDGMLPPTANYRMADAECDLDVIPNRARAAQVEYALSNSFAFGGLNAVLAFRKA